MDRNPKWLARRVNYMKNKDWVIRFPNRDEYCFRNQLVLDLSNPLEVQDYVFNVVDRLKTENPESPSNGIAIAPSPIFIRLI